MHPFVHPFMTPLVHALMQHFLHRFARPVGFIHTLVLSENTQQLVHASVHASVLRHSGRGRRGERRIFATVVGSTDSYWPAAAYCAAHAYRPLLTGYYSPGER